MTPTLAEVVALLREGSDHFEWVTDRLVHVYGESENVDFVLACRRYIKQARAAAAILRENAEPVGWVCFDETCHSFLDFYLSGANCDHAVPLHHLRDSLGAGKEVRGE